MDAAIPADAQNAPTGIWKSRTERGIPTAPTPIIVVVNERKNNGDSNSVAKPSTESDQAQNVKRWRGGQMMLRWVDAGVLEAVKGFRRLKGCGDMPRLVTALRARDQQLGLGASVVNVA